jgi:hypothetical protein
MSDSARDLHCRIPDSRQLCFDECGAKGGAFSAYAAQNGFGHKFINARRAPLFGLCLHPGGIRATQEKQAAAEAAPARHP